MKKCLCICVIVALLVSLCCFVGCNVNDIEKISKNLDDYTIVCAFDEQCNVLSATQTVKITNRTNNTFDSLKFHVFANAYREDAKQLVVPQMYKLQAFPNGESWGNISFDSVMVDDVSVPFALEGEDLDILSVPVEKQLFPNDKVTVQMTYEVQLANIKHRLGYTENTVNLGNFYPILCYLENDNFCCTPYYNVGDPFVSEVVNVDLTATFPQGYVVASSGNLTEATATENHCTYHYQMPACRDFALVASPKFNKISQNVGDVVVNYYYFADENAEQSLAIACDSFEFFNQNVGAYPYKTYSVVETDFCYGGMEYSGLSMVTSKSESYNEAIVHETAHQWFYGVVGSNQIDNAWMDEGLVEFLTLLYLDHAEVLPLQKSMLSNIKTYTMYVDVLNNYYDDVDTSFRPLHQYPNDTQYVLMTYVKGSILFHTLYETMGQAKFWKALQHYYKTAMFTVATPNTMTTCFEQMAGCQLAPIFAQFASGEEVIGKITD